MTSSLIINRGINLSFQGKVLRWAGEDGILQNGEPVYCFVDEGHQFRVTPARLVHGCSEVIFRDESRSKFRVVR